MWKILALLSIASICFVLVWCGSDWEGESKYITNVAWYSLMYNWNVNLWKVALKTDDLNEIIDLYQEAWDEVWYRDSLLIAEKYAQWLWANAFAQDNLEILTDKWLILSDIQRTQVRLKKYWEDINAVLVEYKITGWLVNDIPLLYVSQLFIPKDYNMLLMSFITENKSSYLSASDMFKNIK